MSEAFDIKTVVVELPASQDDHLAFRAPKTEHGGGITVVGAYAVNHATTSSTPTFTLALRRFSSAGTPALSGTVAASRGGTADHWVDSVPKELTIGPDTYIAPGEWVVLDYDPVDGGSHTRGVVCIHYLMGR